MNTRYAVLIDWLRFTLIDQRFIKDFMREFVATTRESKPTNFYNSAVELLLPGGESAGKIEWHTEQPEQRCCFTFTGQQLDLYRDFDDGVLKLIEWAAARDAHFTRVDVAMDIHDNSAATAASLADSIASGETTLRGKTHSVIRSTREGIPGTTVYVGSRQSERFIRVYDKAAERGLADTHWTRIELEAKGDYANHLARRLTSDGVALALKEITRSITCPLDWWQTALVGGNFERVTVDRTNGNRQQWQNTLLLAMAKTACVESEFFEQEMRRFLRTLDKAE